LGIACRSLVRRRDDGGLEHRVVLEQHVLDFRTGDVVAAAA
jgi:hypothetical protein